MSFCFTEQYRFWFIPTSFRVISLEALNHTPMSVSFFMNLQPEGASNCSIRYSSNSANTMANTSS